MAGNFSCTKGFNYVFVKVKPLLEVTASEEAIAAKEAELKCMRESLLQKESDLICYTTRLEQVHFIYSFEIKNWYERIISKIRNLCLMQAWRAVEGEIFGLMEKFSDLQYFLDRYSKYVFS